jgi:hypothetical protein
MKTAKKESPEERAPKKPVKPRKKKVQTLAEWLFEDMSPKAFQKLEIECGVYPGKDDLLFKKLAAMSKQASRKRTIEVQCPENVSIAELIKDMDIPGMNDWNPYFGLKATPPPIPMAESVRQFKFKR